MKLTHKPFKATLAVTMKASLGRGLHRYKSRMGKNIHLKLSSKANLNKQKDIKDLTKAAMGAGGQLLSSGSEFDGRK